MSMISLPVYGYIPDCILCAYVTLGCFSSLFPNLLSNLQQLRHYERDPIPGITAGPIEDDCELVHWDKDKHNYIQFCLAYS